MDAATQALLNRALAAPKTHAVITRFANGDERYHETRSLAAAETHAIGERRKIGRDLLERGTNRPVRVTEVEIVALEQAA